MEKAPLRKLGTERYGFLYDNDFLRNVIKASMKANDLSMRKVSREAGVDLGNLSRYLKKIPRRALSDFYIMKLCKYLKLNVTIKIEFDG